MSKQTLSLILALVLVIALSIAFLAWDRGMFEKKPSAASRQPRSIPGAAGGPQAGGGSAAGAGSMMAQLGINAQPSRGQTQGMQVTGFVESSKPSPLKAIGVKEGDVIVTCNGQSGQIGSRCQSALEGLQKRGEPMTIEVIRNGKRVRLERKEKLPTTP